MAPTTIGNRPALGGAECNFIKMDSGWGLKLYYEDCLARKTYEMQQYAASYGLAPRVGPYIFKFNKNGRIFSAYYTECVSCILYDRFKHLGNWMHGQWPKHHLTDNSNVYGPFLGLPDIAQQLLEIGIEPFDLHYANVGFMPDGRLVCIDFGVCEWV